MRTRVRWLVQVDHTVLLQNVEWAFCGRISTGQGREMRCLDVQLIEVLKRELGINQTKHGPAGDSRGMQTSQDGRGMSLMAGRGNTEF